MIYNRLNQYFDDSAKPAASLTFGPQGSDLASPVVCRSEQQVSLTAADIYNQAWEQARQEVRARRQLRNRIARFF